MCVFRCFQAEGFNGNVMHASVGNVTAEAEFSFEYKARRSNAGSGTDQKGEPHAVCAFVYHAFVASWGEYGV